MNPIDALEHELVAAARRQPLRVPRRALLLAAALIALVAIPAAFATGLVSFPAAHDTPQGLGQGYVAASGTTSRGESWRFELTRSRAMRFRDGTRASLCWAFVVGGSGRGVCTGGRPGPASPGAGGAMGSMRPVSAKDPRALFTADVPRRVAIVRIAFASGRRVTVRPLAIDQARARATGTPYPYGFVAVAYAPRDRLTGLTYLDAHGRDVTPHTGLPLGKRTRPGPPPGPVRQSPAI